MGERPGPPKSTPGSIGRQDQNCRGMVEMGENRTPRPEPSCRVSLRACPAYLVFGARAPNRRGAPRPIRPPFGSLSPLTGVGGAASPLMTSSPPGERGRRRCSLTRQRERTDGCQLRFARGLTRPAGDLGSRFPVRWPCRNLTSPRTAGSVPALQGYQTTLPISKSGALGQSLTRIFDSRSSWRRASRSAMTRRLSWAFRPRARPISSLARPSRRYRRRGTRV